MPQTGTRILSLDVPKDKQYPLRLKGISVCFIMLKAALCGNYVNFGVFKLYGDDTLDNVLNIAAKLILSIPQTDLLVRRFIIRFDDVDVSSFFVNYNFFFSHLQEYPKLSQSYYLLLECLAQDHILFLATLEPNVFLYILESISEGLTALGMYTGRRIDWSTFSNIFWFTDTTICTGCCSTLDNIVSYIFKQLVPTFPTKKLRRNNLPENDMFLKVRLFNNNCSFIKNQFHFCHPFALHRWWNYIQRYSKGYSRPF